MRAESIYVEEIIEHEDGSATIKFDISIEALKIFAAIGLQQCLIDKAKEILDGHTNTEGTGNAGSGEGGDTDFHEQFSGL